MGLFEKIFGKRPRPVGTPEGFFKMLNGYTPTFTSWDGKLYESELVRSVIHAKAVHVSKLSISVNGSGNPVLQTRLQYGPNGWQTWGQFLYRLSTILDMQNNAFIVPVLGDADRITGFFPLLPSRCTIEQYDGEPWLRYSFSDGSTASIEYSKCGIMTKHQYENDFIGSYNDALLNTMELINVQHQGIAEAVKSSATYRFMAKVTNFTKPEDLAKERKRFNQENLQREGGGLLLFPNNYGEIQQIKSAPFVVDADQMQLIRTNIFDYFGINEDILQNKAYGDAWSAFYEGAIEPFAIQLTDVLTKMAFSPNERAHGSYIMANANRLQYMSNTDKLNVSAQMADRGLMCLDEIREIWNLPPIPDGKGKVFICRGEYKQANMEENAE